MKYQISVGDNKYEVEVGTVSGGRAAVTVDNVSYEVTIDNYDELRAARADAVVGRALPEAIPAARPAAAPPQKTAPTLLASADCRNILAPLPGVIIEILVNVGDKVSVGQPLIKIEAMKMLNNITAQLPGTVRDVLARVGAEVSTGELLLTIA